MTTTADNGGVGSSPASPATPTFEALAQVRLPGELLRSVVDGHLVRAAPSRKATQKTRACSPPPRALPWLRRPSLPAGLPTKRAGRSGLPKKPRPEDVTQAELCGITPLVQLIVDLLCARLLRDVIKTITIGSLVFRLVTTIHKCHPL